MRSIHNNNIFSFIDSYISKYDLVEEIRNKKIYHGMIFLKVTIDKNILNLLDLSELEPINSKRNIYNYKGLLLVFNNWRDDLSVEIQAQEYRSKKLKYDYKKGIFI